MDNNELERRLRNIVREGVVHDVSHAATPPKCRVSIGDLESNWLPWLSVAAGRTRSWDPPTYGEKVVVLCPGGEPARGIVLHGLYTDDVIPPSHSPHTHTRRYPDGAELEYDHDAHALRVELPSGATVQIVSPGAVTVETAELTVQANRITLDAELTTCTGALLVEGALSFESGMSGKTNGDTATLKVDGAADFTGDVKSKGVSLPHHKHQEQGDGAPTSDPR